MKTKRRIFKSLKISFATVALCGVLCQQNGFSQRPLRSILGTVTDQHQVPLKGAVVEARNEVTSGVLSYITGVDGRYSFKRLEGDSNYRVWATVHGHRSKRKFVSLFDPSLTKTIDFRISVK